MPPVHKRSWRKMARISTSFTWSWVASQHSVPNWTCFPSTPQRRVSHDLVIVDDCQANEILFAGHSRARKTDLLMKEVSNAVNSPFLSLSFSRKASKFGSICSIWWYTPMKQWTIWSAMVLSTKTCPPGTAGKKYAPVSTQKIKVEFFFVKYKLPKSLGFVKSWEFLVTSLQDRCKIDKMTTPARWKLIAEVGSWKASHRFGLSKKKSRNEEKL